MKTATSLHSPFLLSILLLAGAMLSIPAWAQTYQAEITINNVSAGTTIAPLVNLDNSSATNTVNTAIFSSSTTNQKDTYDGSYLATLSWQDTSNPTNPGYTNTFADGVVTSPFAIGTPIPEITPVTADAEVSGTNGPAGVARTVAGVPLQHLYLYDDYGYSGSSPYYGADRYGSTTKVAIYSTPSLGTAVATISSNSAYGAYSGANVVGSPNANGGMYYDLIGQYSPSIFGTAASSVQSVSFSISTTPTMPTFNLPNVSVPNASGNLGSSQTIVYAFPNPTFTITWNTAPPATNNPLYFSWGNYQATVTANNLYPSNLTWLQITGPSGTVYVPCNKFVTNANTTSSYPTNTTGTTNWPWPVSSSGNVTTTAPSPSPTTIAYTNSNPEQITFTVNLADVFNLGFNTNAPAGSYTITACSYTPCYNPNGGWGTNNYAITGQQNSFGYVTGQHVNSSITTSPQ